MKIALCNEMYARWSIENQFEAFAAWGYDGAELAPFSLDPSFVDGSSSVMSLARVDASIRRRIVASAASTGVAVSGLHWILAKTTGFHITTDDAETRRATARYLGELAEFCAELGGTYMVLGSPGQRNVGDAQLYARAVENAVEVVSSVLPTLEKTGVVLALESLAPTETNFWTTAAETLDFMEKLGAPKNVALHLDCKAICGGEKGTVPETIRDASKRTKLVTFHANDANLLGPGFGELDFKPILEALKDVEFDGWIGVEPFVYEPGIVKLGRESARYLRTWL